MDNVNEIKKELRAKTFGYISGALGLVAGLAWNDAIKATIDMVFPLSKDGLLIQFFYAALVTVAVVLIIMYLEKLVHKNEEVRKP